MTNVQTLSLKNSTQFFLNIKIEKKIRTDTYMYWIQIIYENFIDNIEVHVLHFSDV